MRTSVGMLPASDISKTPNDLVMKIVSVNVASPTEITHAGKTVKTGIFKSPVSGRVRVSKAGLEGDSIADTSVHGGKDQAVYLYSQDDYLWWAEQLERSLDPGTFGENLTISQFSTESLLVGDRFTINGVVLEISAPRTPCFKLAERMGMSTFVKQFAKAVRPGAYARVIEEGAIEAGDEVTVQKTECDYVSVNDAFVAWHSSDRSLDVLKKALASPLFGYHRSTIQDWYDQQLKELAQR